MRNSKRKAAIAALITAGAIAVGAVTGGASSTQARRDSKPPPWCGVICMGIGASGDSQELALSGRKAGKGQQEYLLTSSGGALLAAKKPAIQGTCPICGRRGGQS